MSLLAALGLPPQFGVVLLTFSLALALAPYLANKDFGAIKIPQFEDSFRLRVFGPMLFALVVAAHVPFLPASVPATASVSEPSSREPGQPTRGAAPTPSPDTSDSSARSPTSGTRPRVTDRPQASDSAATAPAQAAPPREHRTVPEESAREPVRAAKDAGTADKHGGPGGSANQVGVQRREAEGFVFGLEQCAGRANRIVCRLSIESPGEDRAMLFGAGRNSRISPPRSMLIDQSGYEYQHDTVTVAGISNRIAVAPQIRRSGPVPAEIGFTITRDVTAIRELIIACNTTPKPTGGGRNFSVSFTDVRLGDSAAR